MEFFKLLSDHVIILFIITLLEAIIIILLLLNNRKKLDEKKNLNDADYFKGANVSFNRNTKPQNSVVRHPSPPNLPRKRTIEDNVNSNLNNKTEQKDLSDDGFGAYAKDQMEKLHHVHETKNNDGTGKIEIEFDLTKEETVPVPISIPRKYEYLEAANGGQFRKLLPSDEKCFFRTWEEDGVRKFEFHGNVDKALANINAIFDDVCEIEGKQNGATQIINLDPGVLTNQLKVDTPAKIKLI